MRAWTRWQDWITLIAGAFAALSPIWVSTTSETGALYSLIVLGVLLAATSLVSLAAPGVVATEWATAAFGLLLGVAPWVFTYTGLTGAAWTSWIVGVLGIALGLSAVPMSTRVHNQAIQH